MEEVCVCATLMVERVRARVCALLLDGWCVDLCSRDLIVVFAADVLCIETHAAAGSEPKFFADIRSLVQSDVISNSSSGVWLDIADPSDMDLRAMGEVFGIHALSLEDFKDASAREKLEVFDRYLVMSVKLFSDSYYSRDGFELVTDECPGFDDGTEDARTKVSSTTVWVVLFKVCVRVSVRACETERDSECERETEAIES